MALLKHLLLTAPVTEGIEVAASIYDLYDDCARYTSGFGIGSRAHELGREFRLYGTWRF